MIHVNKALYNKDSYKGCYRIIRFFMDDKRFSNTPMEKFIYVLDAFYTAYDYIYNMEIQEYEKEKLYENLRSLMEYPIRNYVFNTPHANETEFIKCCRDLLRDGMYDKDKKQFLFYLRKAIGEKRIKNNIDIVSNRINIKRLFLKYSENMTEDNSLGISFMAKPIVLITMMKYFSTYNLSLSELTAFTIETFCYAYSLVFGTRITKFDLFQAFDTCIYYTVFTHFCDSSPKKYIEDSAYILDQSIYLMQDPYYNENRDRLQFHIGNENIDYLYNFKYNNEKGIKNIVYEFLSSGDGKIVNLATKLPILFVYSEFVDNKLNEQDKWKFLKDIILKSLDDINDIYYIQNLIKNYSIEAEMLTEKEENKKERFVLMLKDALKQFLSDKEIHEEMKKEIAPVIDPRKDKREMGFNEEEEKVIVGIGMLLEAMEYATNVDFDAIEDIFTYQNEQAAETESIVDYVTNMSVKYPNLINKKSLMARLENADTNGSIYTNTYIKDCIYKLKEEASKITPYQNIEFIDVNHIDKMRPQIDKLCESIYAIGDELHILDDISHIGYQEAEGKAMNVIDSISNKIEKAKNDEEVQSDFYKFKKGASSLAEMIDKAADTSSPSDKNTFIRTKIIPKLRSILIIVLGTVGTAFVLNGFIALLVLITSLVLTKNSSNTSKQDLINELETDLSMIDRKIDKARDDNDEEKERYYRLLKKKMEVQYAKFVDESKTNHELIVKYSGTREDD